MSRLRPMSRLRLAPRAARWHCRGMTSSSLPVVPASGFPAESVVARLQAIGGIQKVPTPKLTLFIRRGFLEPALCAALMARIDTERRPSTVSDGDGDASFRTSETCDLALDDPLARDVTGRLCALSGLSADHAEPLQGQRYAVGQEFKAHTDFFDPQGVDYQRYCGVAGQRTWTMMIYLNRVDAGGATRFKAIDKTVVPEEGKLLLWNNLHADGVGNPATLHHAMKVRAGTKYVLTQWFRERPWCWE